MSTPLILIIIGLALTPGWEMAVRGLALVSVLGLITIEALARGQLARFLATLAVIAVLIVIVVSIVGLVLNFGWQRAAALTAFVLAGLLMLANIRELLRD